MKIVLNGLQLKNQSSGIGILIYHLFGEMIQDSDEEFVTILSKDSPEFPFDNQNSSQYRIPYRKRQSIKRNLYQTFRLGKEFCSDSVYLTIDSKVPLVMPNNCKILPIVTDLAAYRMKETYQLSRILFWKLQYRYLVKHASHFVAISQCTKNDMTEILHIPEEKIDVIHSAADKSFKRVTDRTILTLVKEKYGLTEQYLLFVGNLNPRKNLERILLAFDLLKGTTALPHKMVIVGEYGWKFKKSKVLQKLKYRQDILFTDYVPATDMPSLYTMADLFVFSTLYEGFGIPIIEAQQCGTPVLTSKVSAMPEVGGQGAIYVDPYDIEDICNGMKRVLTEKDLAEDLSQKGYKNALRFSWKAAAKKLNKIIEELKKD
jgi:glycosyltransferase involved in cell wall biosynthesis